MAKKRTKEKGRPGVMLYFDMIEPLRKHGNEMTGELIWAMIDYARYGVVPDFDGALLMAWEFIKPKVDVDGERYNDTVLKNKYAVYCRIRKESGEPKLDFDEWLELETQDNKCNQPLASDNERYSTTTTTINPTGNPSTKRNPKSTGKTNTEGEGNREVLGEERGEEEDPAAFEALKRAKIQALSNA